MERQNDTEGEAVKRIPKFTAYAGLLLVIALASPSDSSADWSGEGLGLPDYSTGSRGLNDAQRIEISKRESSTFEGFKGGESYYKEDGYVGAVNLGRQLARAGDRPLWYEIFYTKLGFVDETTSWRKDAVPEAVEALSKRGVRIPYGLRVYCTSNPQAKTRAFPRITTSIPGGRTRNFEPVAYITLARSYRTPGSIADRQSNDKAVIIASIIHEIGHILHEHDAGESYWLLGSPGAADTAREVSDFAAGSTRAEFVAEVFTGLVLGTNFSPQVMAEYARYRGPRVQ